MSRVEELPTDAETIGQILVLLESIVEELRNASSPRYQAQFIISLRSLDSPMKTSSTQSKCRNLHTKWLHCETNDNTLNTLLLHDILRAKHCVVKGFMNWVCHLTENSSLAFIFSYKTLAFKSPPPWNFNINFCAWGWELIFCNHTLNKYISVYLLALWIWVDATLWWPCPHLVHANNNLWVWAFQSKLELKQSTCQNNVM